MVLRLKSHILIIFFTSYIFLTYPFAFPTSAFCAHAKYLKPSQQSNFIIKGRFIYNRPKIIPLFGITYSYIKKNKKRLFNEHGNVQFISFFLPQNLSSTDYSSNKSISTIPMELQNIYNKIYLRNPISIWFEEYANDIVTDKYKSLEKEGNSKSGVGTNHGKMYLKMKYSQISSPLKYKQSLDISLLSMSGSIERKLILLLEKMYTISSFKLTLFDEDRSGKQYYGLLFSKSSPVLQSSITGKVLLRRYDEELNTNLHDRYWSIGEIGINWRDGLPIFNKFEKFSFPIAAMIDGNVIIPDTDYTIFPGIGMELKPTFNFSIRNKLSFRMNFYMNTNKYINYQARINHAIAF